MPRLTSRLMTILYPALIAGAALLIAGVGSSFATTQHDQTTLHATTPAGTVVHWAHVAKNFTLIASSSGGTVVSKSMSQPALVDIGWGVKVPARCVPVANLDTTMGPNGTGNEHPGFAATGDAGPAGVIVKTYNDSGKNVPQSFYLVVICP